MQSFLRPVGTGMLGVIEDERRRRISLKALDQGFQVSRMPNVIVIAEGDVAAA
jgi:hypothetical protein